MTAFSRIRYTLLILGWVVAGGVQADDFADRCAKLREEVRLAVIFRDREVRMDSSRSVQELNRFRANASGELHNVYGVTYAHPSVHLVVAARMADNGSGRICAMPEIHIELSLSDFVVYLAKEVTDACHQEIIRQHEQEHVNTWRTQLRAGAQLMTTVLKRDIGDARFYDSREEAEADLRAWAKGLASPWLERLLESVMAAQRAIDTQVSYDRVTSRLRTCGRAIRGGSR